MSVTICCHSVCDTMNVVNVEKVESDRLTRTEADADK